MFIYKITNLINGKVYIGQTVSNIKQRWASHKHTSKRSNTPLYRAIKKYGFDAFDIEQLETVTNIQDLNDREVYFIKHFNCLSPNGYNLDAGGNNKFTTKSSREKLSLSCQGRTPWNKNKTTGPLSEEHKQKIRTANIGKKLTPEQRIKAASGRMRGLLATSLDGIITISFDSIKQAKETGFNQSQIFRTLNEIQPTYLGFTWRYA